MPMALPHQVDPADRPEPLTAAGANGMMRTRTWTWNRHPVWVAALCPARHTSHPQVNGNLLF